MPKPRVLVLDDDEDNRMILETALLADGFDVSTAASTAEARSMLEADRADALVTDLALGDGDAFELMAALGASRPKVAVLVTGYDGAEDRARARAAGFDAHLVKPIALDVLSKTLRARLGAIEPA